MPEHHTPWPAAASSRGFNRFEFDARPSEVMLPMEIHTTMREITTVGRCTLQPLPAAVPHADLETTQT
jgi:hypothetical protein